MVRLDEPPYASVAATAARTAAAGIEIFGSRHASQLERFRDILHHRFLDLMHLLLRVEEVPGDRVVEENLAVPLELRDLVVVQRRSELLLLLERITLFHD